MLLTSLVLARVLVESGAPAPALTDDAVLLIKRRDVVAGCGGDAGPDAGTDGGTDAAVDAAVDAPNDAGTGDANDGGTSDAGCEMIAGDAVTLMVQPRFSEIVNGTRFAILMVTPSYPIVETHSAYVFTELAAVTAPKVEVIENRIQDPSLGRQCQVGGGGCGGPPADDDPYFQPPGLVDARFQDLDGGFTVDQIGPYQIVRAQPTDIAELATWLTDNNYVYMQDDLDAVAPYIARGYTVVALRVSVSGYDDAHLSPIALTWAGSELRLPVALGSPSSAALPTTVYIAADGRYELPGAHVPFAWKTSSGLEGFLTRNEVMLEDDADPADDPVAMRVVGDPEVRDQRTEYRDKRVPINDCSGGCGGGGGGNEWGGCGCRDCSTQRGVRADWIVVIAAVVLSLRRRKRPRAVRD